jgi:ElaB/YqjD/DUF883 family membrane-anchored ribosome-binding protein
MSMQESGEHRDVTAFFATRRAADKATENLRSAGFGADRVKIEEGSRSGSSAAGYVVRVAVMGEEFERVTSILDDEATLALDERGNPSNAIGERVQDTVSSVRSSLEAGAEKLRSGAERLTGHSSDDLAAQARDTANQARAVAANTGGAVVDYVKSNPLLALSIAFGVGMLIGGSRRR